VTGRDNGNKKTPRGALPLTSLSKGLTILLKLKDFAQPVGLSEMSRLVGIKKPTLYRLLGTLELFQFVEKDEAQKYRIGANAFVVGSCFQPIPKRAEHIRRVMTDLAADYGHTITLSVLRGVTVLYIARVDGKARIRVTVNIGSVRVAYSSSSGKAILAGLPDEEIARRYRGVRFKRQTEKTHASVEKLLADIRLVRSRGYAVNDEESNPGVFAIAVPVHDKGGRPAMALSCIFPARLLRSEERAKVARRLQKAAREIESLGIDDQEFSNLELKSVISS
jgi:IclR family acetate operon transcriptional repressor